MIINIPVADSDIPTTTEKEKCIVEQIYSLPIWLAKELYEANKDNDSWDLWETDDILKYIHAEGKCE